MKIDLKKDRRDLYRPGSEDFTEVDVPPMTYVCIEGHGDPNTSPGYPAAVAALYAGAFAIKFARRERTGGDFVVGPLEGLWSSTDPAVFAARRKDDWDWTMMIPLSGAVSSDDISLGLAQAARNKPELPSPTSEPSICTKDDRCRSCTSVAMTPRLSRWPACTVR